MTSILLRLGLSPAAARWTLSVLLIVVVVAACAVVYDAGYSAGRDHLQASVTKQQLELERQQRQALASLQARNDQLTQDLSAASRSAQVVYRTIREQVPHVVKQVVEIPVESVRDCRVTRGFVWLWDDASVGRVPEAAGSAAHGPARTGEAGSPVDIGFHDLLANHVDNAEIAGDVRRQCQTLIDWHRANDR